MKSAVRQRVSRVWVNMAIRREIRCRHGWRVDGKSLFYWRRHRVRMVARWRRAHPEDGSLPVALSKHFLEPGELRREQRRWNQAVSEELAQSS